MLRNRLEEQNLESRRSLDEIQHLKPQREVNKGHSSRGSREKIWEKHNVETQVREVLVLQVAKVSSSNTNIKIDRMLFIKLTGFDSRALEILTRELR